MPINKYTGFQREASGCIIASNILKSHDLPTIIICRDSSRADELVRDLRFFLPKHKVAILPAWDSLPLEAVSPQKSISAERVRVLGLLHSGEENFIAICPIDSLVQKVIPPSYFSDLSFTIELGNDFERTELINKFLECGYSPVSLVEEVGDLCVRGNVIDFFPSTLENPVRLQFLDDEIEEIRTFNPDSQRSIDKLSSIKVLPTTEVLPIHHGASREDLLVPLLKKIQERAEEIETPASEVSNIIAQVGRGTFFPGIECTQAIGIPDLTSVLKTLQDSCLVIVEDEVSCRKNHYQFWEQIEERYEALTTKHYLVPKPDDLYLSPELLWPELDTRTDHLIEFLQVSDSIEQIDDSLTVVRSNTLTELYSKLQIARTSERPLAPLAELISKRLADGFRIVCVIGSISRAERLQRLLQNYNITLPISTKDTTDLVEAKSLTADIQHGHLTSGFILPDEKRIFISEADIFGERSYRATKHSPTSIKKLMSTLSQLSENDYVVHIDYGVGQYQGLTHKQIEGVESDLIHIRYADSDLFLPVQFVGRIQKFVSSEGVSPTVDKLSSQQWQKTKRKVREAVAALAGDLLKLYAARSISKGWCYDAYGAEDERFSDGFPWQETPDQLQAIQDVLADMQKEQPMDRLVCGDVGFGKTEVAMRAAYKAIQHAKQVAILVPTTVLVEQHKNEFQKRFLEFPVKIGAVSRFYSSKENKETLEELSEGKVDIVVGTHRLLSRDVVFRDLGLLVIDEEHRFGVKQKEKLKQFKKEVDVLTLTATPIPRTLHMSMSGIRDISLITTPPHDRKTIRTYVASRNDTLIRDAILRELRREGQCFFVHNRVQSIETVTAALQELVPEASFDFGHGQMPESKLDDIMRRFINKEFNVLVCTTIIESGLDIPNANTIIIDRSDMFGLAQLYQLRGRVGRSERQAYAYLLIPEIKKLGNEAQKRLEVLQSLDDLGVGFNLAIRDLEIRGAGALLGREQSGHVISVGFELYNQILQEAVLNLKGEEVSFEDTLEPEVKVPISAFLPHTYVPDVPTRLVLYQRLCSLSSPEEASEISEEIEDRFGPMSREVRNLVEVMRVRALLRQYGVEKLEVGTEKLVFVFHTQTIVDPQKLVELIKEAPDKYKLGKTNTLTAYSSEKYLKATELLYPYVEGLLNRIRHS